MTKIRILALACCVVSFTGCNTKSMSMWMAESSWMRPADTEEVGAKPIDAAPLTLTPQTMSYSITPLGGKGEARPPSQAQKLIPPTPPVVTYSTVPKARSTAVVSSSPVMTSPPPTIKPMPVHSQIVSVQPAEAGLSVSTPPPAASKSPSIFSSPAQASTGGDITIGSIAPDFTLKDLNGNHVSLSQYRGRTVVLTFWGTRCVPCRHEAPFMSSLQQKYLDRGLVVLGVDAQDSTPAEVRRFAQAKSLTHTLLVYGWEMFKKRYHGEGLPRCYVLDHDGRVTARFDTYLPGDDKDIDAAVQRTLTSDGSRPVAFNLSGIK